MPVSIWDGSIRIHLHAVLFGLFCRFFLGQRGKFDANFYALVLIPNCVEYQRALVGLHVRTLTRTSIGTIINAYLQNISMRYLEGF
jgi:hypothetical protein